MASGKSYIRIIIPLAAVNAAGFLLRHFNLDTYIILIGFRFQLAMVLPLLIYFRKSDLPKLKKYFTHPSYNGTLGPLGWIFLPLVIVLGLLFILKKAELGDPDYFYEFGMSSIIDYPIYLVWNLPQLFCFAAFVMLVTSENFKSVFMPAVLIVVNFAFEFVPAGKDKMSFQLILSAVFISLSAALLLKYFRNIYWISIILFTILWSGLLAFGSGSTEMIHLLFASQYQAWDGFFDVSKNLVSFVMPAQAALTALFIFISVRLRKVGSRVYSE